MNVQDFYPIYQQCNSVQIDSRKVKKGDLFFAFSGDAFNAASLAEKAIQMGARAVIVEDKVFENKENNIFYSQKTLLFLQDLAHYHRAQLSIPVIALTGSNGKTTTKELMQAVLAQKYQVLSTVGNYNNHIGVPLTLLSIKPQHELAVIEMGANHQKEIEFLCDLAQPTMGYITNFGKAHLEGFGGVEGVIAGKSEMYTYLKAYEGTILVNAADAIQTKKTADYPQKLSFGTPESDYYFASFIKENFIGLTYQNQKMRSHLTGVYNFDNLSAAVALGLHFNVNIAAIALAIENYIPTNMRSQVEYKNGKTLVIDTYNANPSSVEASLNNFKTFPGSKTVILGDMRELGEESVLEHQNIMELAHRLVFDQIITVGPHFKKVNNSSLAFQDTQDLIAYLEKGSIQSTSILLKGSRGIALEKVLNHL